MPLETFMNLREWCLSHQVLAHTRVVTVDEQLAIFLCIVSGNWSNRATAERFQHSGDTISRKVVLYLS